MCKICAMSDLHGQLPKDIQPCDIVLICGDISPLNIQSNHTSCRKWIKDVFNTWANNLPCEKVYLIAGNHDRSLETRGIEYNKSLFIGTKVVYLENSGDEYITAEGRVIKIWGTPACHIFGNWSFMFSEEKLTEIYSQIPENIDILLTHDQPFGYGDVLLDDVYWADGSHIGNKPLAKAVLDKQPQYMFIGHLHSTTHSCVEINNTKRYNVSLLNERYEMVYEPLYLDI